MVRRLLADGLVQHNRACASPHQQCKWECLRNWRLDEKLHVPQVGSLKRENNHSTFQCSSHARCAAFGQVPGKLTRVPSQNTRAERGCSVVTRKSQIMTGPGRCAGDPAGGKCSVCVFCTRCCDREGLPVAPTLAITAACCRPLQGRNQGEAVPSAD